MRVAIRMGYHRDPRSQSWISPFDGEMRRRVWMIMRQYDRLTAFQQGIPGCINSSLSNTELPRHLLDDDLEISMAEVPVSRAADEMSPVSYFLAKEGLLVILEEISNLRMSQLAIDSEQIEFLDAKLVLARKEVPAPLKMESTDASYSDEVHLTMMKFTIEVLYLKSICYLRCHDIFLRGPITAYTQYSRKRCHKAAREMIQNHLTLHHELLGNGQTQHFRWMISSVNASDLYVAVAFLVSILLTTVADSAGIADGYSIQDSVALLEQSLAILEEQQVTYSEAREIVEHVRRALARLQTTVCDHPTAAAEAELRTDQFGMAEIGSLFPDTLPLNWAPENWAEAFTSVDHPDASMFIM